MKWTGYFFFFFVIAILLWGCDRLDQPEIMLNHQYLENIYGPVPDFPSIDQPVKAVLVEEFSGHLCGFCPPASHILKNNADTWGDRLVAVNIHAGTLAAIGNPPFQTDFTTAIGNVYWGQLENGFNPCARIDRQGGVANFFIDNQWTATIESRMKVAPAVAMQMITSYISQDKNLNIHIQSRFLQGIQGTCYLVVLLTESQVISPQLWYGHNPETVGNYEHHFLLREGVTGAQGIPFIASPSAGDQRINSFTFPMKEEWQLNNCSVAAFIIQATSGEVLNAVTSKIHVEE